MPATIKDVATAAGVSVTTVSHALNDKGRMDPATRAKVRGAADRLGYRANPSARSLRSGRTGALGLLLPNLGGVASRELLKSEWYARVCIEAAGAAFARGSALVLLPADGDSSQFVALVDGVIAVDPIEGDPRLRSLDEAETPVVTMDCTDSTRRDFRSVVPDSQVGLEALLTHLHEQGARKIAVLYADINWPQVIDSVAVYRKWMNRRRLSAHAVGVKITDLTSVEALHEASYVTAHALLRRRDRPDAVVALFGGFAIALWRAARDLGLTCPDDVMIAQDIDGFAERTLLPSITALDMRPDLQAAAAVDMLIDILGGNEPDEVVVIPVDLHRRTSTSRTSG